jgi:hypothetical protein
MNLLWCVFKLMISINVERLRDMQPLPFDQSGPAPLFMGWSNLLQGSGSSAPHRMHCQVPMHSAHEDLPDNCLLLSVTTGVFDEIQIGAKVQEYRPYNNYWKRRLIGKSFAHVAVVCGQKRTGKVQRTMIFDWCGYEVKNIRRGRENALHSGESAGETIEVFAVNLMRLS